MKIWEKKTNREIETAENQAEKTGGTNMKKKTIAMAMAALLAVSLPTAVWAEGNGSAALNQGSTLQLSGRRGNQQNGFGGIQGFGGTQQTATSANAGEIALSTAENAAASLEADMSSASYITISNDNSAVEITQSGTYVITGESSDGSITVKKGVTGVVLVLNDLNLTSKTGAALSVNKEAQAKIIVSGSVTLTDGENPADETSADEATASAYDGAAMKFKADSQVVLTGEGTLTINGSAKNGIKTGDNASLIVDGNMIVNMNAVNDGINGSYDVTLLGGNITIAAGDDAIHADHILTVGSQTGDGPTITIRSCKEGLEGTVINMFGGNVTIQATDDAINAANSQGAYAGELAVSFNMTGGTVNISSRTDGIDSNGNVNLIGGSAAIQSASFGGEAGIDYDGQYYLSASFSLNNASGVSGPDGMGRGGQMNGMQGFDRGMGRGGWGSRENSDGTQNDDASGQAPSIQDGQSFFGQGRWDQGFGHQGPWGQPEQRPDGRNEFDGQMPSMNGPQQDFFPGQGGPGAPFGQTSMTEIADD